MKITETTVFAPILTAFASSLCCITPVVAFLAGTSGLAASFSWIEPARPYLMVFTALFLGFAWYRKLKPTKTADDCNCSIPQKKSFLQSKIFLSLITVFAVLTTAFPYYADAFFPKNDNKTVLMTDKAAIETAVFTIEGMTCTGCEAHVVGEVSKLKGIIDMSVSYEKGNAMVTFDKSKINTDTIINAVNSTGYTVIKTNIQ